MRRVEMEVRGKCVSCVLSLVVWFYGLDGVCAFELVFLFFAFNIFTLPKKTSKKTIQPITINPQNHIKLNHPTRKPKKTHPPQNKNAEHPGDLRSFQCFLQEENHQKPPQPQKNRIPR